jgi:thiamine biosynthesis lipoprotein ApbE
MEADALATALFVMGPERGSAFAAAAGVEALTIDRNRVTRATPGFSGA